MEIARDLFSVPARPGSGFSGLNFGDSQPANAGAGTWVCGNRKTIQMVPALAPGCKCISRAAQEAENRGT